MVPFKRVTDNAGSNFDTVPQKLLERERQRQGMFIYFHDSYIISHFLITFNCFFFIICWLSYRGLICAHRSIFSNTYIHRLRHRLNSCSHSWDTKTRVNILIQALCFHPLLSGDFTHTYCTFLPLFFTKSQWVIPSTDTSSLSLSHPWGSTHFSPPLFVFVLSHFIPMLHSSLVRIFFIFFLPTPLPPPHQGQQRPTGTYLVPVFIPTACLWPTGKLQSVICLQVDRNLPFSSSLAPALTSKLVTTLCLNLRSGGSLGSPMSVCVSLCWSTIAALQEDFGTLSAQSQDWAVLGPGHPKLTSKN